MRMLAKKREDRYPSLPELALDLVRIHKTSSLVSLIHEGKRLGVLPKDAEVSGPVRPSAHVPAVSGQPPTPPSEPVLAPTPGVQGPALGTPVPSPVVQRPPSPVPKTARPTGRPSRGLRLAIVGAAIVVFVLVIRQVHFPVSHPRPPETRREIWTPKKIKKAIVDEEVDVQVKLADGKGFEGRLRRFKDGVFTFSRADTGRKETVPFSEMKELILK